MRFKKLIVFSRTVSVCYFIFSVKSSDFCDQNLTCWIDRFMKAWRIWLQKCN